MMDKSLDNFPLSNIDNEVIFLNWVKKINNIDSTDLHRTILDYDKIITERERRKKFAYIDDLPFAMMMSEKKKANFDDSIDIRKSILDIEVSSSMRKKVYTFVNQLIRGIEKLGGHISTDNGYKVKFEIFLGPLCWDVKIFEKSQRDIAKTDLKKKMLPKHHRTFTGTIELDITNKQAKNKTIFTSEELSLSRQLVDIFSLFRKEYIPIRDKNVAEIKKRELEDNLKRQKEENERLAKQSLQLEQAIEQRKNQLVEEVLNHQKEFERIKKIDHYLNELTKVSETDEKYSKIVQNYVTAVRDIYNIDQFFGKVDLWNENMKCNM